jgi:Tol biopolymer transport system component
VTLEWFDRTGRALGTIGGPAPYEQVRLSPDGTRVAAAIEEVEAGSRSVWILEEGRDTPIRFTFAGTHDWQPVWSPDGTRIAFGSYRDGPLNLYIKAATGAGNDEPLVISDEQKDTGDFSADGRHFAYTSRITKGDVLVTTVAGAREIVPIARTDAEEGEARFAGDGRWIAYTSDETGRKEVFVQPFPPTGAKWQVSVGGGQQPAWRGDGRELFYVNDEGTLLSVAVAGGGPSPVFSAARPLFSVGRPRNIETNYDVTRDGKRFLVAVLGTAPPRQPATVILNWPELLSLRTSASR